MTAIDTHTDIPTAGDKVDYHRDEAMHHAERVERLAEKIGTAATPERGLNQLIGLHLKLADIHARLAVAVAQSATVGATHREVEL